MSFADAIRMVSLPQKRAGLLSRLSETLGWLFSKIKPAALHRPRELHVEERLAFGPKKSLTVVRCGAQRFLVASGADTITAVLPLDRGSRRVRAVRRVAGRKW
ncbi:MAG TPA: flagellar biosynthetic protein FliO [Acidisarcina sp.]|nr:flagellar biosynthetic protein FliO [Acidisarcina sp.]